MDKILEVDPIELNDSDLSEVLYGSRNPYHVIYEKQDREKANEFWHDPCWSE